MRKRRITIRLGKVWICFLIVAVVLTASFILCDVLTARVLAQNAEYRLMEMLESRRVSLLYSITTQQEGIAACAEKIGQRQGDLRQLIKGLPSLMYELLSAQSVALTDMDGKGIDVSGREVDITGSDLYAQILQGADSSVDIAKSPKDGETHFHVASVVRRNGEARFILTASYATASISESLLRTSDASDVSLLVNRKGDVLMRTERTQEWNNLIERLRDIDAENEGSAEELSSLLQNSSSGFVPYQYHGEKWYSAFKELGINDWLIVYRVQAVELEYIRGILQSYLWILYTLLLCGMAWLAFALDKRDERLYSDRRLQDQNLRASRECLRILAGHPGAILCDTDLRTNKTYVYGGFMSVFGRDPVLTNFPFDAARVGMMSEEDAARVADVMAEARHGVERAQAEITMQSVDDAPRPCRLRAYVMRDENGEPFRVISRISEMTEEKAAPTETAQIPGSVLLSGAEAKKKMNEKIQAAPCTLLLVDIDNSLRLSEKLGSEESEKILSRIIEEITSSAGKGDLLARLGGDEFAILFPREMDENALRERANEIQNCIMRVGDEFDILLTASAGSAVSPKDGVSFDELYFKADTAQYMARQSGNKKLLMYRED